MADTATTPLRGLLTGDTAALRRRRNAQIRLQAYGIGAISLAALALIALLWSVVGQATGALSESYITLPVELKAEDIDPGATGDPKIIYRANFPGIARDALRARFDGVKGRKAKRRLNDLISVGAAFELAQAVSGQPSLIGQTIDFRFLASDVTDLYLKGSFGGMAAERVGGDLSVIITGRKAVLTSTAADFSAVLGRVRENLLTQAAGIRAKAALQENGVRFFRTELERAETGADRDAAQAQIEARTAARDKLIAAARALEVRARATSGVEKIGPADRSSLVHVNGGWLRLTEVGADTARAEVVIPPAGPIENFGGWSLAVTDLPERSRKLSDAQMIWIEELRGDGAIETVFNWRFFTAGDSRDPELAGIRGAVVGSFWTMLVTFVLAFPIGVLSAIYLEEFAPKNRLTDLIEVNINNLAAVPSIIFGLLGLSVVIGFFGVPRSAPLAGGMVMALMTLPTIIIAARATIAAVPPSIREAALGVGASQVQTAFHHVLPLAMPGILTGTIIGMARALGETAPLIMIGMVAFIVDIPGGVTDSATVLPVQVYRWSDFPERAFEARTAAAICTLLVFLVLMNALAIFLRRRFERRW